MDPEHHWQMRVRSRIGRTCNVEVQAVELGLLEHLIILDRLGRALELDVCGLAFFLKSYNINMGYPAIQESASERVKTKERDSTGRTSS